MPLSVDHVCRCGTYQRMRRAIHRAARRGGQDMTVTRRSFLKTSAVAATGLVIAVKLPAFAVRRRSFRLRTECLHSDRARQRGPAVGHSLRDGARRAHHPAHDAGRGTGGGLAADSTPAGQHQRAVQRHPPAHQRQRQHGGDLRRAAQGGRHGARNADRSGGRIVAVCSPPPVRQSKAA